MKLTFIFLISLTITTNLFCQITLTKGITEADIKLKYVNDLNVFSYYELTDYDTPLKKEVYKKTGDYARKLAELTVLKNGLFYIKKSSQFRKKESAYDIKKKGFNIPISKNWGIAPYESNSQKSIEYTNSEYISLKSLTTFKQQSDLFKGAYDEFMFLPINEESGLEIENAKESIDIYFIFTPNGSEKISYNFIYAFTGRSTLTTTYNIKTDKVRVVVVNNITEKIYFDKTFIKQIK